MSRQARPFLVGAGTVALLALAFALSPYHLGLLALVASYAVASLAQNLLSGYAAVPSLGNIAFFAASAYTTGTLLTQGEMASLPAILLGIAAAGALGFIVGMPALRISGMHLAIVTVALVFVSQNLLGQWDQAHGQNGVSVSQPSWLLQERPLYIAAILAAALVYLLVHNLLRSRTGRAIAAMSENAFAAQAAGIDTRRYRLSVFVLSGAFTGVAGVVYLYYSHTVTPAGFSLDLSLGFLTMMILGGSRSLGGSLLGAAIIGLLPELLRVLPAQIGQIDVQQSVPGLYAILLLLTLRFFPEGLWNMLAGMWSASVSEADMDRAS